MIEEHARVVLVADLPGERFKAGDVGAVVHIYPDHRAYEIEFITLDGRTAAVATVEAAQVREVRPREMMHARPMSAA